MARLWDELYPKFALDLADIFLTNESFIAKYHESVWKCSSLSHVFQEKTKSICIMDMSWC